MKPLVESLKAANKAFHIFRPYVFEELPRTEDDLTLTNDSHFLDMIQEIVAESMDCQLQNQVESGWNNLVHTPLIKTALSYPQKMRGLRLTPW